MAAEEDSATTGVGAAPAGALAAAEDAGWEAEAAGLEDEVARESAAAAGVVEEEKSIMP